MPVDPPAAPQTAKVVILDLDGTLIGRIGNAVCEYEIARLLDKDASGGGSHLRALKASLVSRLRYGIIRPHVENFCKALPPGVELFVYTASEQEWAAFIVPCVEAALDLKFNRPLFTRAHCVSINGDLKKSIRKVLPTIQRALKRKGYQSTKTQELFRTSVVLVDNTPGVLVDPVVEGSRLVVCPTYSYNYVYDVIRQVDVDTLHRSFKVLIPVLQRAGLFPQTPYVEQQIGGFQQFAAIYYSHLSRAIASVANDNVKSLHADKFWIRFSASLQTVIRRDAPLAEVRSVGVATAAQPNQRKTNQTSTKLRKSSEA